MSGRTFAIGDVHGCDVALATLLDELSPGEDDRVIVLGDVVDRGPGTKRAIDLLLDLKRRSELVFIKGNHEEMMLSGIQGGSMLRGWLRYGGQEALASYGGSVGAIPVEHVEFLASGLDYFETETDIFVHASLHPGEELDDQPGDYLRWTHIDRSTVAGHFSGKRVICGHTSQKSGLPLIVPQENYVCIDTFAHGGQFLTGLEVGTDRVTQTRQDGTVRKGLTLADFL